MPWLRPAPGATWELSTVLNCVPQCQCSDQEQGVAHSRTYLGDLTAHRSDCS